MDIATPEIIPSPAWGDLERLNKERDLVGIYLSAHPLDEYAVILENVCNVHMAELADLTPLQNRDLTMGGIVTAVREGYTKTGKPYGIAKVEDYSGSAEFAPVNSALSSDMTPTIVTFGKLSPFAII